MNDPKKFYKEEKSRYTVAYKNTKKQLAISSTLRLLVFLSIGVGVYFGYPNSQIVIGTLLAGIVLFILLINRHTDLTHTKNKFKKLIEMNQLELDVFANDISKLSTGEEYIDSSHPFGYDIDLYGKYSFFQYLNRTATKAGKDALAQILNANSINAVASKQDAIKNLSKLARWRQDFNATALLVDNTTTILSIQKWLKNYTYFVPRIMRFLPTVVTSISMVMLVLLFFNVITFNIFLLWFFVGLGITGTQLKKINRLYSQANKAKLTFEQYHKLIRTIENTKFTSVLLQEKQQLVIREKEKASKTLRQFAKVLSAFDQRNNMMFGVVANGLMLWDIVQSYRIEQWIRNNQHKVNQWFEVIAFFDAYNSLGNFAFNHPNYVYPEIIENSIILRAKGLGHPLLDENKRVDNDISIDNEQFLIITGANMAGKSTFLRTVALQIVMSNIGLPICAQSCQYRPIKLISSMRTSDSLSDDASYFFSELTQLKIIVDAIEEEPYFIILDEILKGTNSKDKATGSRKFVEKLVSAKATGIIATHDLSLCAIAEDLPQVQNRFFDAQIVDNELYFDYKFKEGICQNMNASFLLKKMGIVNS
ncbi:DNA mismatch repair protein MutS [Aquimarina sp. U1-2]|uniref:MutS-related protein n=1 Tax=Aquimarina sp. U1-2 TaxID=2823141 RepID=UPI001AECFFB7|nr:DNA mismatch repair protein MutS [Aquimarina sp. U1-2]MBP2831725.1 DNA mismatch repair protein MutS [Aquimarina sp. U1-2]